MYWWGKPYKKINFWVTSHFNIQLPFVLFSSFLYIFLITFLPTFFLLSYLPTFLSSYLSFLLPSYLPSYIYMRSCFFTTFIFHTIYLPYLHPFLFPYWGITSIELISFSGLTTIPIELRKTVQNPKNMLLKNTWHLKKYYISTPLHLHTVYLALFFHLTWSLYSSVYLLLISAVLSPQG